MSDGGEIGWILRKYAFIKLQKPKRVVLRVEGRTVICSQFMKFVRGIFCESSVIYCCLHHRRSVIYCCLHQRRSPRRSELMTLVKTSRAFPQASRKNNHIQTLLMHKILRLYKRVALAPISTVLPKYRLTSFHIKMAILTYLVHFLKDLVHSLLWRVFFFW